MLSGILSCIRYGLCAIIVTEVGGERTHPVEEEIRGMGMVPPSDSSTNHAISQECDGNRMPAVQFTTFGRTGFQPGNRIPAPTPGGVS